MQSPLAAKALDKSTEQGFQFVFKCETCGAQYQSPFVPSRTAQEKKVFNDIRRFGGMFSRDAALAGAALGGQAARTPAWNNEHSAALLKATSDALTKLHECPRCHRFVCDNDWKSDVSLCALDAAQARSAATLQAQASAQAVCPKCGRPSGGGKFCNNCGAPTGPTKCAACGAENSASAKFCGGCGAKL